MQFSQELLDSIQHDLELVPHSELEVLDRFRWEPYRHKLIMMFRRLRATRAENEQPFWAIQFATRAPIAMRMSFAGFISDPRQLVRQPR